MAISVDEVRYIAALARLRFSEEEEKHLAQQMSEILQERGLTHQNAKGYPAANCVLNPYKGYLKSRSDLYAKIRKSYSTKEVAQDSFA